MSTRYHDDRFITFSINDETYAIEVLKIQEVIYVPEITKVPGAPAFVAGVINLRGILLTIVDTSMEFGLKRPPGAKYNRIVVVVLEGDQRVGLLVDDVSEVVSLNVDAKEPLPTLDGGKLAQYAHHIIHHDDHPVTLLEMERIKDAVSWHTGP
jgi:purine-binding chemotaxis protein CheW